MARPRSTVTPISVLLIVVLLGSGYAYYRSRTTVPERVNVLVASEEVRLTAVQGDNFSAFVSMRGEPELAVMDFSETMPLDPPPAGWWHRKFLLRFPMEMSFGESDGEHGLRLATDNSASMLFRFVDVDLQQYPLLAWRWKIEDPIDTDRDELTREGDDHPARLFIGFRDASNQRRAMEIIWGNRLAPGDYKTIGGFPHYVANAGSGNVGRWLDEEVNLLEIYRTLWPGDDPSPRITDIGLFCDSDETNDDSIAWFSYVKLKQQIELPL